MNYEVISDRGEREINEDSVMVLEYPDRTVFVLGDGLGGHGYGEVASHILTECAGEVFGAEDAFKHSAEELLKNVFESTQRKIYEKQRLEHDFLSYKTTAVVLTVEKNYVQWGYIGDSRLYYFENHKLMERTLDHSVPQMLVNAGKLRESRIRGHVDRNKLLRVLGAESDTPKYVINAKLPRLKGQRFLLCSDGFWEWIDEKNMIKCMKKSENATDWLNKMKAEVLKVGSGKNMDNYSAIAVML